MGGTAGMVATGQELEERRKYHKSFGNMEKQDCSVP